MLEEFIKAYLSICSEGDNVADREELTDYCRKKNLDMKLVEQWIEKFDVDKDDQISMEEFCRALGLSQKEMQIEKVHRTDSNAAKVPNVSSDFEIILSKLSKQAEYDITERVRELFGNTTENKDAEIKDISNKLKQYLDDTYDRVWQVVILRGSYWMNFSHEPFKSIQFKYGPYIILLWRTPKG
ncbi:unnamed protein product [Trichobilharzia regenti]|uniref:EF-hand domain-containing protein n=1 Tax=Trichobilharzia regenti TaxID=157069 RepID=A0A183WAD1_TRIRE|nr:unnamed protein product [Trichobilharzia regenti]VDQ04964.1 unnamed protein product [Trichobilharzia regenti]